MDQRTRPKLGFQTWGSIQNHDGEHHENEELTDMQIGDICCDSDLSPEDTPLIDLNIQTSDKNLIMSEIRSLDIIFADRTNGVNLIVSDCIK